MPDAAPDHLHLAVCDYPEHVPQDRWATYAAQQRALGLSYVRVAEFAWSRIEPREGEFDWAWLDEAIGTSAAAGLKVVMCTPTATPPAWLVRAHPEILPVDREGRVRNFGSRRHYDFASPVYREHARRITRAVAERYGRHPAVAFWQTDNEYGCHDTARSYGPASAAAFREWLRARYGHTDALNEAWGNVFWSQDYRDWSEVDPPNLTVTEANPSHILDYYRFCSDMVREFNAEQAALLRELSPGRPIGHNFMIFESGFDHYPVAQDLDFVSWDSYPTGMLEQFATWMTEAGKERYARTGHPDLIAFNHDLYRGLKRQGFWVMEQQCGQVNWAPYNPLPADGAVRLWTAQAWAHGADVVSYFRWRASTIAQEVMHSGLLRHDERPDRGYAEVQGLDPSAFPLGAVLSRVALLHDYESLWIMDAQKHSAALGYWAQTFAYYSALRALGVDVDVVHPDSDLSGYAVVVAPAVTLMTPERAAHLTRAAEHAQVVFGPRTGFRTHSGRVPETGQFGPLSALVGAKLRNYDSLRPGLEQEVRGEGGAHQARGWAEGYELHGARALYTYMGGPLDGQAAVVQQGNVTVVGAHGESLIAEVLGSLLARAGVSVTALPEGLRVSRRAGVTLVQNWSEGELEWQGRRVPPVSCELVVEGN